MNDRIEQAREHIESAIRMVLAMNMPDIASELTKALDALEQT